DLFSHELAEVISHQLVVDFPTGAANAFNDARDQLADDEPDGGRYLAQMNTGDVVQAYWSAKDQAYIVPDGYAQTTYDEPQWLTDSSGNLIFDSAGNPTFLALKEVSGTQVVGIEGLQGLSPGQALPPGNTVWFNDGTQDLYYQAVTDSDQ